MLGKCAVLEELDIARESPKRARYALPSPSASRKAASPLTTENLQLWDTLHTPMVQSTAASEASFSAESSKDIEKRQAAYGIFIHRGAIPETLQKHINEIIMDMRRPTTPSSARFARDSRTRDMNEPQGKEMFARDLLFKTKIEDGEELIQVLSEVAFGRHWLPTAPDEWVERQYDALEQPRPGHAVGYITQQDACSMDPRSKAALERTEEDKITRWAASGCMPVTY